MSGVLQRRFPSPLRYPGGKGKVANFIKLLFLKNDLVGHRYVEPYAGGASVALSLLYEGYASHICINDLNRSVFAFWYAVTTMTDDLCRKIIDTPVNIEEWERQKTIQRAQNADILELAFSTFFLNRTNRSGIIDGGVIGGKDQEGAWKLDARYNKTTLVHRIEKVARNRSRITLSQLDAAHYLQDTVAELPSDTFLYLDPPYYVKGKGLYEDFYKPADHHGIAQIVHGIRHPWLVSYDAVPEVLSLYGGFNRVIYELSYSAAERYHGDEVMFFSPKLNVPDISTPSNIRVEVVDRERRATSQLF